MFFRNLHSLQKCRFEATRRRKRGIGIMEVMVAALVLGLLYVAVSNLQKGNREALLRIRGRDGATEVAQNIIDSLGALGLASFSDINMIDNGDGTWSPAVEDEEGNLVAQTISVTRVWEGQPGIIKGHDMVVPYTVNMRFSGDDEFKATSTSLLLNAASSSSGTSHVYAKRVDITVSWPFKNSMQSISVSGVIR